MKFLSYLFQYLAFLFTILGTSSLFAEDPQPSEPADELHIDAVVGIPLEFPLEAPSDVTDINITGLPEGLNYDPVAKRIQGTATQAGESTGQLTFTQAGVINSIPAFFHILPEGSTLPEPPNDPRSEPVRIFGTVGEPLNFPLPYDAQSAQVDFGQNADGTPSAPPAGLQFDAQTGSFVGVPEEAGVTDFTLVIFEGETTRHMPIVFEIQQDGTGGGVPGDEPVRIFGIVGEPLNFPLPYDAQSAQVDFGQNADGTPSAPPAGLQFDAQTGSFVGVPEEAGVTDFTLVIFEGETTRHMPIVFEIQQDGTGGGVPGDEPVRIFGIVGEPLNFPLPYDAQSAQVDFGQNADGTPSAPPAGLQFDAQTGSFVGVPEEAGVTDFTLVIFEGETTRHMPIVFEIQPAGSDGGFPGDPNDGPHPINIVGNVGQPMNFPLPIPPEIGELQFEYLPEGLAFDASARSIVGSPLYPGYSESGIVAIQDGQSIRLPVFFDIFGDYLPDDGGPHEQIKIHGFVGEFLSFPLPFPIELVQIELTQFADGTLAPLPTGIELDAPNAQIIGFPQEPGFFESSLTVTENGERREIPVFFEIQHPYGPGGDPSYPPPHDEEYEDEDIILFGAVGTRFSFQFPTDDNETVELPEIFEEIAYALPSGLSYNADLNTITGAPTESGVFETLVLISKPDFQDKKILRFLISDSGDAPRLSFFSESEFQIGQPFSFPILASGDPTLYDVIDGLPEGVSVDSLTGIVSGVLDIEDDFDLIVKVSNDAGDAYGIHFLDVNYPRPDDQLPPDGVAHVEETEPFPGRVGVPFRLQAPEEYANAVFTLVEGESFPTGIGFDSVENAVISGTPTETGLFKTRIAIERDGQIEDIILTFFIFDDAGAPQFVSGDYLRITPGEIFELPLIIANGPADISIETDQSGISLDTASNTLRGTISEPGFYTVLALAENDSGSTIHLIDIDVWDDGSYQDPNDSPTEPMRVWAIVGQPLDFPLPADPFKSEINFVSPDGVASPTLPQGLEYVPEYALIKGIPELEGTTDLFVEITEFGFTRREHIIFEIHHQDNLPDDQFPPDPGHDEPDDGHVEPILGKVGERLYFEAPIEGDNIVFELVPGPDGEDSELPPGISFDDQAGILSGVPTRSGIYPIWVKVDDNGSVRTHFAPLLISGAEGSPVITSEEFISLQPGEHFEFQVKADNEPTQTHVEFFDVPGILSYDAGSMILKGKFEFGGFFTLLIVAENEVGTGYGLLNVDVLGFNGDPNGGEYVPPADIPLQINGAVGEEIDFELPSYVRGSSFVISLVQGGIVYSLPEDAFPQGLELDPKTGRISGIPEFPGYYFVRVNVDGGDLPSLAFNIGIIDSLPTPKIVSSDWMVGHQESPFYYYIYATDYPFEFFAAGLPAGLSLDSVNGAISGTPTEAGEFQVMLSARNATGTGEQKTLYLRIEEKPRFPIVSAPYFLEGLVGEVFELQVNSTFDPHIFHAFGLPSGLSINPDTGLISGTPVHDGFFNVRLEAHNEWGMGAFQASILIKRAALAPIYRGPKDLAGKVGQPFFFNPPVEGSASEFSISENSPNQLPAGLTIDPSTGLISGSPTETFSGVVDLFIQGEGGSVVVPVNLKIVPGLDAPLISSSPFAKATSGQAFQYMIVANNSPTEFRVDNLPAGLSLNTETGLISGAPDGAGYYDLIIQARNVQGWGHPRILILDIIPAFEAPIVISAPYARGKVGEPFEYQTLATNSPSSYIAVGNMPAGLSFEFGLISGIPTEAGVHELILAASNASGLGNGMPLIISIQPSQAMPRISSSSTAFGKVNEPFQYRIIATGEPTSYEVDNLPDGLSLNTETGFITGTPIQATEEPIVLVLYAINAAGSSLPRAVLLEIQPSAEAPEIISGGHSIGKAGQEFQFQVFATNEPTSFFSANLPQGLSIASDTGLITGTPQAAGEFSVVLQASNAAGTGEPAFLKLFILPGATMPQITSSPYALGKVSEEFDYQIETSAEQIDSYQVHGELPRGLDFDPVTGLISGTPVEPGVSLVELTATNVAGTSMPQSLILKIQPSLEAPIIISSLHARGRVDLEFSYEIQATNMPEERPLPQGSEFDAIGLPSGLGINQTSGVIAGTPEESGLFRVVLVATNVSGQGNPKTLFLEIFPAPDAPKIFSASKVAAQVGAPFNYQILATNSPSSYDVDHSISWLSVDTATGFLSGSPDKPGIYYAEMVAKNESGQSEYAPLHIVVYPAENTPKIISDREADGQIGSEFSHQIVGTETPTAYIVSGLPSGLSLDAESGEISGVPNSSGTFEIVVAASNDNGLGTKAILLLEIQPRSELTIIVTDNNE